MEESKDKKTTPIPIREQQIALEAFGTESYLSVNKKLLSKFGPGLTIYIGNLIDKLRYFSTKEQLQEDGSFFLRQKDQTIQTGMSQYHLQKYKKKLKEMGILHTEMRGIPPKEFYLLNVPILINKFLSNCYQKIQTMDNEKIQTISIENFKQWRVKNSTDINNNRVNDNKECMVSFGTKEIVPNETIKAFSGNAKALLQFYLEQSPGFQIKLYYSLCYC